MKKSGLVLVFTGDGKGKTTAAIGSAVRMTGWGKRVVYCTFFKNSLSGEMKVLKNLKNCKLFMFCRKHPAFSRKDIKRKEFEEFFASEWTNFREAFRKIKNCDLLIMDEILIAVRDRFIKEKEIISFVKQAQQQVPGLNIILTGRGMSESISDIADIITEMKCIKHPYPNVRAIRGIEY